MREATDLAYWAWTIIANVSEGRWEDQTEEWQEAAKRWRDAFHETLDRLSIIESEADQSDGTVSVIQKVDTDG